MKFRELWDLPPEIWSHVFCFLSSFDKKNVRLTCSTWYGFCNTLLILRGENLAIRTNSCSSEHIFQTLTKCKRQYLNITFHGIDFREHSLPFWERCGTRIYLLEVIDCYFNEESFQAMIYFCQNLERLKIVKCDVKFALENILRKYQLSEIKHKRLVSLCLENCAYISDYELSSLFGVYTNIEELMIERIPNLNCFKRVDERFYGRHMQNRNVYNSKEILTFSCIFYKIKSNSKILKKLSFRELGNGGLTDDWFDEITSLPDLRLHELQLSNCSNLSERVFINFFSKQTSLKTVIVLSCKNFTSRCLLNLIKTCPELECLEVAPSVTEDSLEMSEIQTLLTTLQLKSLHLRNFPLKCISKSSQLRSFSLIKFLPLPSNQNWSIKPICGTNLTYLYLADYPSALTLTNRALQTIFEHMINLTFLYLWIGSEVTDYGFTGIIDSTESFEYDIPQFSISRLKLLKSLNLFNPCSDQLKITQTTFLHFIFPNLSNLHLRLLPVNMESFVYICRNTPMLECLRFDEMDISCTTLLEMCKNWRRLKVLMINPTVSCDEFYSIAKSCPHLRFLRLKADEKFLYYDFYHKEWKTWKSDICPVSFFG